MFKLVCYNGVDIAFEETHNTTEQVLRDLNDNLAADTRDSNLDLYSYRIFQQPEPKWIEREWRNSGTGTRLI